MLFNSYFFILIFLPVVLLSFHFSRKHGNTKIAIIWLIIASLFFYGWWKPEYLFLIILSIVANYAAGLSLLRKPSRTLLTIAVTGNLLLLGYYKYSEFAVENLNSLLNVDFELNPITLPLAISFFTFQQIAFLVDTYRGQSQEPSFIRYCLFVTFFPQLIAGPIVHHREVFSQFSRPDAFRLRSSHLSIGMAIFFAGLFKKVVFADSAALYATPVFEAAERGVELTIFEAWGGVLAYSFQLYFDFSGYSDMAIGLARMFGIILPVNFYSPYKANSIIDFWRRWHITLSNFLRDYVYIPLGGNRHGLLHRYRNLILTFLLGGIWHGAGWTFLMWGAMHGVFVAANHGLNRARRRIFGHASVQSTFGKVSGRLVTFLLVVVAWVVFRAESFEGATVLYSAMFGLHGVSLSSGTAAMFEAWGDLANLLAIDAQGMFHNHVFIDAKKGLTLLVLLWLVSWFGPNTLDMLRHHQPALNLESFDAAQSTTLCWRPTLAWAIAIALVAYVSLNAMLSEPTEFLYFQF